MRIITGPAATTPRGDHLIDAAVLPNPHDVPKLRPRNGQDPMVRCWILDQPETQRLLLAEGKRILTARPEVVTVTCSAGWHRSVTVGDELARRLAAHGIDAAVEHQGIEQRAKQSDTKNKNDRAARGYALDHKRRRTALMNGLVDGAPCWWCGLPMYRDSTKNRNWDGRALARDHVAEGGARRGIEDDRLLHFVCNSQRQDGRNDHLRPALTGRHPSEPLPTAMRAAEPVEQDIAAGFNFGGVTFD